MHENKFGSKIVKGLLIGISILFLFRNAYIAPYNSFFRGF